MLDNAVLLHAVVSLLTSLAFYLMLGKSRRESMKKLAAYIAYGLIIGFIATLLVFVVSIKIETTFLSNLALTLAYCFYMKSTSLLNRMANF